MRLIDLLREPGERSVGDVDHGVAPMADEVGMARCAEVVEGGAIPGVDVLDDTDLAETLQHPIHRRRGDPLLPPAHCVDQVVSSEVGIGVEEHAHDEPGRRGRRGRPAAG